jgi:hypothetical protein
MAAQPTGAELYAFKQAHKATRKQLNIVNKGPVPKELWKEYKDEMAIRGYNVWREEAKVCGVEVKRCLPAIRPRRRIVPSFARLTGRLGAHRRRPAQRGVRGAAEDCAHRRRRPGETGDLVIWTYAR